MEFNFDEETQRRDTLSLKWDVKENELPMWVADMDFKTAPAVRRAIENKACEGIFGYNIIPDEWSRAYVHWWKSRHDFEIESDSLIFATGVVPAISTAVRKLTCPAEKVLVLTPVYNIFYNSISNNGRYIQECPLEYSDGNYEINFELLEENLSDPQISLMIFCNPHNPVGKIWDKETLCRVGELCAEYNVAVISDEIHCDLTDPGKNYIPFASASAVCRDISVTCLAPTKSFGIPGIQTAAVMVPNRFLRHKMWRGLNTDEVAEPNSFAIVSAVAAYNEGAEWLDAVREYIYENKKLVRKFVAENIPSIKIIPSDATYLLWFDCSKVTDDSVKLCGDIRTETGLFLNDGAEYRGNGNSFFRMNVACPRCRVEEGLRRLKKFFDSLDA